MLRRVIVSALPRLMKATPVVSQRSFVSVASLTNSFRQSLQITVPSVQPAFNQQAVRGMANQRHKKIIKQAKGFRGRANRVYSIAFHRVLKAKQYAYRDRKVKKRNMRKLWILRMNAAVRMYGIPYSRFIKGASNAKVGLDRKILADLAVTEPLSFKSVVEVIKAQGGVKTI